MSVSAMEDNMKTEADKHMGIKVEVEESNEPIPRASFRLYDASTNMILKGFSSIPMSSPY
jgi:hypothetical protein